MSTSPFVSPLQSSLPTTAMVPQVPSQSSPAPQTPPTQSPQSPVTAIQQAIGQFESQGNYNAIGKQTANGDRAYGKYQVMGSNIPSWTQAALGTAMTPQQFLQDPQAQNAVASYQMSKLYTQYGNPADVASAWFSGKPLAQAGNASDVNGTTVPAYVEAIMKLMGGGVASAATLPQSSSPQPSAPQPSQSPQSSTPSYPGMPPVAQFSLPTPGQTPTAQQTPTQSNQSPAAGGDMPPVAQFSLPQSSTPVAPSSIPDQPFSDPLTDIASGNGANGIQRGIGALKGIGQFIGPGQNPVLNGMLSSGGLPSDQQLSNDLQPSNFAQSQGAAESNIASGLLLPGGQIGSDIADTANAAVPDVAKELASPQQTLKTVKSGLLSFRENPQVTKDAQAIQPMVQEGLLKAGNDAKTTMQNVSTIKGAIRNTAENLISQLKGMPIQPIVQPEELDALFQNALSEIEKNPYLDDTAKGTAAKMFEVFKSKLPTGQDLTASDLLQARKDFDATIESMKPNAFDPKTENATSLALRTIRQGVNGLLKEKAPTVAVEDALSHQTSLYNVLDNVVNKGAGAVKKANEIANMGGLKGIALRHPYISAGAGLVGTGLLEGAGLGTAAKYTGLFNSQSQ